MQRVLFLVIVGKLLLQLLIPLNLNLAQALVLNLHAAIQLLKITLAPLMKDRLIDSYPIPLYFPLDVTLMLIS